MKLLQPGDRVVYIYGKGEELSNRGVVLDYTYYLKRGTVVERYNELGVTVLFDGCKVADSWHYDWRFELEYVYDSPLEKALR